MHHHSHILRYQFWIWCDYWFYKFVVFHHLYQRTFVLYLGGWVNLLSNKLMSISYSIYMLYPYVFLFHSIYALHYYINLSFCKVAEEIFVPLKVKALIHAAAIMNSIDAILFFYRLSEVMNPVPMIKTIIASFLPLYILTSNF